MMGPMAPTTQHPVRLRRSTSPTLAALDRGGQMMQRRMRDLTVGSALILAPAVVANLWATAVAFDRFDPSEGWLPSMSVGSTGVEDVSVWLGVVTVGLATALVGFFASQILLADRFGRHVGLGAALRTTLRRLPAVAWLWLLTHWWVPLVTWGVVTSPDGGAGLAFLLLPAAWVASSFTLLSVPIMVGEAIGPLAAARRAFRLARMRFGACGRFVVLSTLLGGGFVLGMATLAPLLEVTGFVGFGGLLWLVQGVLVQLGVLLTVPIIATATAQLYVELRVDAEGLDLVVAADSAFGVRS